LIILIKIMDNILKIIGLLETQRGVFSDIEEITRRMLDEDIENFSPLLEERGKLLEKAVSIEEEIRLISHEDQRIGDVLGNRCDMTAIPDDLAKVFEASMRVKAIINRIKNMEEDIRLRMEAEREAILKKIESLNVSSNSVAGNYKRAVQTGFPQSHLGEGKKTV